MPTVRKIGEIKSKLLHPALTSHFEVKIPIPNKLDNNFLTPNGLPGFRTGKQDHLNLLCSETILPGSNLATLDINNDHTGVTERHAYRRIYDDRIDFTFYVDADNYLPIKYFELWMKFIVDESKATQSDRGVGAEGSNYFYRIRYPEDYMCQSGLEVIKFERTGKGQVYTGATLKYEFVNAFPISVSSMPVSYEASSLLKCSVSFSYIRYLLNHTPSKESSTPTTALTPGNFAQFNTDQFKGIENSTFSTPKTGISELNRYVETQEQYYNRIYGEA